MSGQRPAGRAKPVSGSTVVHFVDSHFPTRPGWSNRSIGGMSSGGFCALNLGLRHQALFGSVLAFEPYGDPGTVALGILLHGNRTLYAANSPRSYLPRLHFQHPMQFFLDVGGASGHGIAAVRALAQELQRRGERTDFRVEPGQTHTWTEASAGFPYALAFCYRFGFGGTHATPRAGLVTAQRGKV